jgi:hypothetical protein
MKWRWLLILVLAYAAWDAWQGRAVSHPPGVLVADAPLQTDLSGPVAPIEHNSYRITPLQSFSMEGRVLAAERYRFDREADLSPVDLALGWGAMSNSAVLSEIEISQGRRFYFWRAQDLPISRREIETHSANMHMIPATRSLARALKSLRPGQIVKVSGYLVEVHGADSWTWRSSLTRDDTGAGACELVWVIDLDVR